MAQNKIDVSQLQSYATNAINRIIKYQYIHKNLYKTPPDVIQSKRNEVLTNLENESLKVDFLIKSLDNIIDDVSQQESQALKFMIGNDSFEEFKKLWAVSYAKNGQNIFKEQKKDILSEISNIIDFLINDEETNKISFSNKTNDNLQEIKDMLLKTIADKTSMDAFSFLTSIENPDKLTANDRVKRKIMALIVEIEKQLKQSKDQNSFYSRLLERGIGATYGKGGLGKKAKIQERGNARGLGVALRSSAFDNNAQKGSLNEVIGTKVFEEMLNDFFKGQKNYKVNLTSQKDSGAFYGDSSKDISIVKSVKADIEIEVPDNAVDANGKKIDLKSFGISAKIGENEEVKLQTVSSIFRLGKLLSSYETSHSLGNFLETDDFLYIWGNELKNRPDQKIMDAFKKAVALYGYIYIGNETDIIDEYDQYFGLGKKYANILFLYDADKMYRVSDLLKNLRKYLLDKNLIRVEVGKLYYDYGAQAKLAQDTPIEDKNTYYNENYLSKMQNDVVRPALNKVEITMRAHRARLFEGLN